MNKVLRYLLRTFWQISLILAALMVIGYFVFDDLCANTIQSEIISPNGLIKAVIFERDCGATTGFVTHISVLKMNDILKNVGGNVFVARLKTKKNSNQMEVNVGVRWVNDVVLEIEYDFEEEVIKKNTEIKNIEIKYKNRTINR